MRRLFLFLTFFFPNPGVHPMGSSGNAWVTAFLAALWVPFKLSVRAWGLLFIYTVFAVPKLDNSPNMNITQPSKVNSQRIPRVPWSMCDQNQWRVQCVSQIAEITLTTKKVRRAVWKGLRISGLLWKQRSQKLLQLLTCSSDDRGHASLTNSPGLRL